MSNEDGFILVKKGRKIKSKFKNDNDCQIDEDIPFTSADAIDIEVRNCRSRLKTELTFL